MISGLPARWKWHLRSSGTLRCVILVLTDVSTVPNRRWLSVAIRNIPQISLVQIVSKKKKKKYKKGGEDSWKEVVQLKCDSTRWRGSGGETGEWNGQPVLFTLPRNMVYPASLPLMSTPRLTVVNWTDAPAHLNGLVRFAERRNLVSAHVPSHFKRSLQLQSL